MNKQGVSIPVAQIGDQPLQACYAVDAREEVYRHFGKPEIVNTDQGSQFTARDFVDVELNNQVKLSNKVKLIKPTKPLLELTKLPIGSAYKWFC